MAVAVWRPRQGQRAWRFSWFCVKGPAQMPDIEVLAVEIKRFHGTSARTLVPRVIGRTAAGPRRPGRPGHRLTRESFLDGFEDEDVRGVAERLLDAAVQSGADIYYATSFGLSIRAKCSAWPRPITVAWLYSQPGKGWMRTRDFSFGVAVYDYVLPEELRAMLERWVDEVSADSFAEGRLEQGRQSMGGQARGGSSAPRRSGGTSSPHHLGAGVAVIVSAHSRTVAGHDA